MSTSPEQQPGSPAFKTDDQSGSGADTASFSLLATENDHVSPTGLEDIDAVPTAAPEEKLGLSADISDDESVLSEVDEAQFEDFDPATVNVEEERPQLAIDEENLKLIGRHKRKRSGDGGEDRPRRKKEGRRDKKARRLQEQEEGGEHVRRKDRKRREQMPENDETLDPATRRRRALDRIMDEALKKPTKRRARKADGIDLEQMADAEIEDMRKQMTNAAQLDAIDRREGRPAMHKLRMLPEVVSLLNRNQYTSSLVDPEINLLEAVKFFLEPLDDGSLPAYNIQRDLMTALTKLPINKETLIASGIGKVIVFYTKVKRVEPGIKRTAERLLAEWTRPILQRSDDYSKRVYEEVEYDPSKIQARLPSAEATAAEMRAKELLPPRLANRARPDTVHKSYTIVPRPTATQESKFARPLGASGEDRFRRMRARQVGASKGGGRK